MKKVIIILLTFGFNLNFAMEYPNTLATKLLSISTSTNTQLVSVLDESSGTLIILSVDADRSFTLIHPNHMLLTNSQNGRHLKIINQDSNSIIILRINVDCSLTVVSTYNAQFDTYNQRQINYSNLTILSQVKDGDVIIEEENCIICRDKLSKKEINLSCNHNLMHYACLAKWMEINFVPTCPICRKEIVHFDDF